MVQGDRQLLWHPRLDYKFLVGGGSQVTAYELLPDSNQSKYVASKHDITPLKCLAWSPDPAFDDLVAIGYGNGKVDLTRLEAASAANHASFTGPSVTLPVRNSRSCNTLAFCGADPNYLAVGLDKVRGEASLVIWDLVTVTPSLSIKAAGAPSTSVIPTHPQPQIPRGDLGPRTDARILQQHAPAEVVSSVAFLPKSTTALIAGISHRWLRLFDFRSQTPQVTNIASKVHGIVTDPFDPHRIGCYGDGIATIWDSRRLVHPLLTFTEKDASADGARVRPNPTITSIEFSPVRRGLLATLEKDANHVRFWDLQHAEVVSVSPEGRISRDSSHSSRVTRLSWANPMLPWATSGMGHATPPATPGESSQSPYHLVLSNTRRTKYFNKPLSSFALVPSADPFPLTSTVMAITRDGELELQSVYDTPTHTPWSPRGDLSIGIGRSYRIIPGFRERDPPPEPWDIVMEPSVTGSAPQSAVRTDSRGRGHVPDSRVASPPLFGRGDEDGFPALIPTTTAKGLANLAATRPGRSRGYSPAALRNLNFEHSTIVKAPSTNVPQRIATGGAKGKSSTAKAPRGSAPPWIPGTLGAMQHCVEGDISMIMRRRVIQGYGIVNPLHNSAVARDNSGDDLTLSEVWLWIYNAQQTLSFPSPLIEGYSFSYHGILGVWEGFRPLHAHISAQPTPRIPQRGLLLDAPPPTPPHVAHDSHRHRGESRHTTQQSSRPPPDDQDDDFLAAISILNARKDSGQSDWRPPVATAKLGQRQLALYLCGWSLADGDLGNAIKKWEREHKHSQAACWLVFMGRYKQAVDLLMRSKDETHHMMSGMLAALTPLSNGMSKNNDLREHCERLIVRLQDPYLKAILTHLTVHDDWLAVLNELEESLPLRERLAIAFQFLDDKEASSYLRRAVERCIRDGNLEGLVITGLTIHGMDILQAYVDTTGDVQSAAVLAALNPARSRDYRTERWLNIYRDLLDQWKLFHYRCQLDIDRGRVLQEAIQQGEIEGFEWTPKQIVLRCNYCNKPFSPGWQNGIRATSCQNCKRALPRCSICLMTLNIVHDSTRWAELAHSGGKDTIDEALVFCQTCRHGGHSSHILEWFYGGVDGSRSHGSCPVSNCHCRCADAF